MLCARPYQEVVDAQAMFMHVANLRAMQRSLGHSLLHLLLQFARSAQTSVAGVNSPFHSLSRNGKLALITCEMAILHRSGLLTMQVVMGVGSEKGQHFRRHPTLGQAESQLRRDLPRHAAAPGAAQKGRPVEIAFAVEDHIAHTKAAVVAAGEVV